MTDITTIGEILIDLTQTGINEAGIPQFSANPGGAPANLAVAAAKLGASTAFIGKVGDDSFGKFLVQCLKDNKVDISQISYDKTHNTTMAVVSVDASGERSFSFYRNPSADTEISIEDISEESLSNTKFLHFGSVSLTTEPCKGATLYAARTAKENGAVISYDPNYRANLWTDEATAISSMKEPLSIADILKVSDEELPLLSGTSDLEKGTEILMNYGIKLILVTLGADGAFYRYGSLTGKVAGVKCVVADTNGSGDTFFGALLSRLVKFDSIDNLSTDTLEEIITFANTAASLTTSRHGAIPAMPVLQEVQSHIL